ncbi:MAG: hypothetical protein V1770_01335 [bacterium]
MNKLATERFSLLRFKILLEELPSDTRINSMTKDLKEICLEKKKSIREEINKFYSCLDKIFNAIIPESLNVAATRMAFIGALIGLLNGLFNKNKREEKTFKYNLKEAKNLMNKFISGLKKN